MTAGRSPSSTVRDVLDRLPSLETEEARLSYARRLAHGGFAAPVVLALNDEANRLVRVDLQRATRLAELVLELARRVGDDHALARSHRTLANMLHQNRRHQQAMAAYERALALFEAAGDEHQTAITLSTAIHNLIYLGDYERAFDWAARARAVFERRDDRLRLGRLILNYANILYRQDRWEEALEHYADAHRRLVEAGEPLDVAVSLRTQAVCQISLGDFAGALASYQESLALCREHDLPLVALENEYNIAYLYYQRGEYTRALQLYKTVREEYERHDDREHLALCDLDQSEIFLELNLVEEAAQLGQSAFDQFEDLGMDYEAAKAVTILAIATSRQGKEFLALELLDRARTIFDREGNEVWKAQIDLYQALLYYSEGRFIEAASLGRRAHAGFSSLAIHGKTALCDVLLARLALESQEPEEARRRCRQALGRLDGLNAPALAYQALFVLGQVEEAAADPAAALDAYSRAQQQLERLRSHLQADELKITFLEDKLVVYESLVSLLLADPPTPDDQLEAFRYIEKAKSRSLADLMAFRAHALPSKSTTRSNLVEQVRGLREELNWYYRRIDLHQMQTDEAARKRLARLRDENRRREEHLVRTLRELQSTDQEFSSLQDATTADLAAIREQLAPGAKIVEFYVARDVVHVCVVGHDDLQVVPLTISSRTQELHRLLQFQLSKFLLGSDYVGEFLDLVNEATRTHLRGLYDELLAPIAPLLDCDHLVLVPHDYLHHVPFQALHDGERYLIDRFSLSYAPSASVYYLSRRKPSAWQERALVLGVGAADGRQAREAEAVAAALGDATLLVGDDASEEALRGPAEGCRVLHLTTHGVFRRDNPMFSALELAGSQLNLFDLYNLRLNAELVVLSGCGTGLNVVVGADELVGLARGILYAGAKAVLVTLWDVDEEAARGFLTSFYRHYREHRAPALALQSAMREVREERPHPYYWAPYALMGSAP